MTTTGYLWSRGLAMYRDIKFVHTPGLMGLLALGFRLLGPTALLIRFFSTAPPLLAHAFVLRETRSFPMLVRALASAFFVVSFLVSDGNAVWPTVVLSVLALPMASLLSRRKPLGGGLLIGAAILFKQTSAFLLLLAAAALFLRKRFRDAAVLLLCGSAPYLAVLGAFALGGAGRDMIRWTIEVPLLVRVETYFVPPGLFPFLMIVAGFVPLAIEAAVEEPGEHRTSARWLLLVAAGMSLLAIPRFDMMQTVGALPCLAVGAARLMRRGASRLAQPARGFVAALVLFRGAVLVAGSDFDGRILFWNDEEPFNRLVEDLRGLPPGTPLHSKLWGNLLPRTGLLPPGRIYVHPWLDFYFPVDRIGERVEKAAKEPGTVIVGPWGTGSEGRRFGPYSILTVGREDDRPPRGPSRP